MFVLRAVATAEPRYRGGVARPIERLAGWLVTGPLGHLWSGVADLVVLWARLGLAHLRRRAAQD